MNSLIPLTIYGIGVYHPKGWKLFINPNTTFNFNEGMVKIDKESAAKTNAASLSIRWATMKNEVKIDDYVNELDLQLQKSKKEPEQRQIPDSPERKTPTKWEGCLFNRKRVYCEPQHLPYFWKRRASKGFTAVFLLQRKRKNDSRFVISNGRRNEKE